MTDRVPCRSLSISICHLARALNHVAFKVFDKQCDALRDTAWTSPTSSEITETPASGMRLPTAMTALKFGSYGLILCHRDRNALVGANGDDSWSAASVHKSPIDRIPFGNSVA
jgi:hypothetical protein